MEHAEDYQYEIDVAAVAELWRRGSVVSSWLLDLTAAALQESPKLAEYSGRHAQPRTRTALLELSSVLAGVKIQIHLQPRNAPAELR